MRRLAIFVEGYTEVLFVERLIFEIAGLHNVIVEQRKILGGAKVRRVTEIIKAAREATNEKYYVLLVDCGGDHQVKTRIQQEHENLTRAGYVKIIGLRDVRPTFSHHEIAHLETGLRKYIKTSLIPVEFVLAVMEIEAWFLAEYTHYAKIDPSITLAAVTAVLGFDPEKDDLSLRPEPCADLEAVYGIGGKSYLKPAVDTIDHLDYAHFYLGLRGKIAQLKDMLDILDSFLS